MVEQKMKHEIWIFEIWEIEIWEVNDWREWSDQFLCDQETAAAPRLCACVCVWTNVDAYACLQSQVNHNKGKQTISSWINQSCSAKHRIHLCQQVIEQWKGTDAHWRAHNPTHTGIYFNALNGNGTLRTVDGLSRSVRDGRWKDGKKSTCCISLLFTFFACALTP